MKDDPDGLLTGPCTWGLTYLTQAYGKDEADRLVIASIGAPTAVEYDAYIRSPEWTTRADAAKTRAGGRCQVCCSSRDIQAHHRTYERLGRERPEDIVVLCDECHGLFHSNGKLKR